uniref:Microfibril associated protein 5 n=1 Tax=Calidris pygmaea TaxID=425635 RepID=A0A8C3JNT6_9CHAR
MLQALYRLCSPLLYPLQQFPVLQTSHSYDPVICNTWVFLENYSEASPKCVHQTSLPFTLYPSVTPTPALPSVALQRNSSVDGFLQSRLDCREEKFPCTRLYSVHKPVKQCISYLCVTSVRRMYIINKEVCSRIVCKENEVMQGEW